MSPPFFLASLSPLLAAVLLQLLSSNVHTVDASITICSRPAAWTLHDVVSQLLSSQQIDLNNSSISLLNSTNSSTNSTNSQLNLQLISKNAASPSSSSSENGPLITNLSLPITNSSEFSRRLFGDHHHHQESLDRDNVTLVVLTSSSERRLGTEQQLLNLEAIYQTLLGVHLTSLRFVLLNSRTSFDPAWVAATRRRVSFEVYQELPTGPPALDGRNGDIFIYDRCGFLTYYIPFPLSFIHTQQPILQAAVLATYFDSPCRAKCNSSTTSASATTVANVTETAVSTVTTATPATTVSSSVEATATEAAAVVADNQTDYSSPSSSSFLNDSLLPMVNLTAEQVGNFNDMGQILLKFFGQIAAEQQQQQQQQANNQQENAVTAVNLEATTSTKHQTNTTANVDGSSVKSNVTSSTLSISSNGNSSSSSSSSLSVLDRLRGSQRPRLEVTTCTATVCNEWSTERLLKARLCCLNSPEGESSSSSSSSEANSTMITSTTVSPGNSSSSFPSGFGCTLYARRNQCSQIMPVIRCCLRKVLNKYFDFTIRLREQQQRSQGGGGGNGGGGRQLGSLTVDHTGSIGGGQSLATSGGSAGGNGGGGLPREVVSLEYPADYVLGGVQQSDYLKQQHRKRVNRRVVGGGVRR